MASRIANNSSDRRTDEGKQSVRESEVLFARKRLIAALFSLPDGALPLDQWLSTLVARYWRI
jgi:hypothetical protein